MPCCSRKRSACFKPSKYLTFSVHLDGQREHHDFSVCREGGYDKAVEGIREAVKRGFRVTTNTTLFDGADPNSVRAFFDEVMAMGVEGIVISPGYSYDKAPDQKHFLGRARTRRLFRAILSNREKHWKFNMSPLFLEFLMGKRNYQCTPWGNPAYNIFGWQKPCYLLQDGYASTFKELIEETEWENYGTESGNPKCANCMVSCGYEPSSVNDMFGSFRGFMSAVRATLFDKYVDQRCARSAELAAVCRAFVAVAGADRRATPSVSWKRHGYDRAKALRRRRSSIPIRWSWRREPSTRTWKAGRRFWAATRKCSTRSRRLSTIAAT